MPDPISFIKSSSGTVNAAVTDEYSVGQLEQLNLQNHLKILGGITPEELNVLKRIRWIIVDNDRVSELSYTYRLSVITSMDGVLSVRLTSNEDSNLISPTSIKYCNNTFAELEYFDGIIRIGTDLSMDIEINLPFERSHIEINTSRAFDDFLADGIALKSMLSQRHIKLVRPLDDDERRALSLIRWVAVDQSRLDEITTDYAIGVVVNDGSYSTRLFLVYDGGGVISPSSSSGSADGVQILSYLNGVIRICVDWSIDTVNVNYKYPTPGILIDPSRSIIDDFVFGTGTTVKTPLKIQVFGDSISDETWRKDKTTWATLLSEHLPEYDLTLVNSAVGGTNVGTGYSGTGRYSDRPKNCVYDLLYGAGDDYPSILETDADIIIMFIGTNDYSGNRELGQITDDTGDTHLNSMYRFAKLDMQYVAEHSDATMIVCTPCGRYNSDDQGRSTNELGEPLNSKGLTLRKYCDALVEVAHLYGFPVLDLNYDLGWNRFNVGNFCSDGLHPTATASQYIAMLMASEIKRHIN